MKDVPSVCEPDNLDRLTALLNACHNLAPYMSAAISDPTASDAFRKCASQFTESYYEVMKYGIARKRQTQ